jgi:transcription elongation factor Elf1
VTSPLLSSTRRRSSQMTGGRRAPDPEFCPFCGSAGAHFVALPDPAGVELAECGSCHQLFDPDDPGCTLPKAG